MAACMYLLKAFKKKYWNDDKEPSIFCSYFFKTACLWVFEGTRQDEINAIKLCREVFDWLISCYANEFLPHFFIPEQNLIGHILGEKERLKEVTVWLDSLKSNIWITVIPSIQTDHNLQTVMRSTCEQLNLPSSCDDNELIYKCMEDDKAGEVLQAAVRDLDPTNGKIYQKHQRLTCVKMANDNYPPLNAGLNMIIIRAVKKVDPTLPEINENVFGNEQLVQFNAAIDCKYGNVDPTVITAMLEMVKY